MLTSMSSRVKLLAEISHVAFDRAEVCLTTSPTMVALFSAASIFQSLCHPKREEDQALGYLLLLLVVPLPHVYRCLSATTASSSPIKVSWQSTLMGQRPQCAPPPHSHHCGTEYLHNFSTAAATTQCTCGCVRSHHTSTCRLQSQVKKISSYSKDPSSSKHTPSTTSLQCTGIPCHVLCGST